MRAEILRSLLNSSTMDKESFTDDFMSQISLPQLQNILDDLRTKTGPVIDVEPQGGNDFLVSTATHWIDFKLTLGDNTRISGLRFRNPRKKNVDFDEVKRQLSALEGQVSVLVTCDGKTLFEHNAQAKLAVGSAFKLGVLSELAKLIDAGSRSWSDVVALQKHHISLPSGILHTMPIGSPLTLHSLAALMISKSDNTATDALIDVIGRSAMADALGPDNLLTTREFFVLKTDDELRQRFLALQVRDKPEFLDSLKDIPAPADAQIPHHQHGVEWYLSADKLHDLLKHVRNLDVMSISPCPARAIDWQHIACKGGSEEGVRNRSLAATDRHGRKFIVILTLNSEQAINASHIDTLCEELVASLTAAPQ